VSEKEGRDFAAFHKIHHFETSAKTGRNINEAFVSLSQTVFDKIQVQEYHFLAELPDVICNQHSQKNVVNFQFNDAL